MNQKRQKGKKPPGQSCPGGRSLGLRPAFAGSVGRGHRCFQLDGQPSLQLRAWTVDGVRGTTTPPTRTGIGSATPQQRFPGVQRHTTPALALRYLHKCSQSKHSNGSYSKCIQKVNFKTARGSRSSQCCNLDLSGKGSEYQNGGSMHTPERYESSICGLTRASSLRSPLVGDHFLHSSSVVSPSPSPSSSMIRRTSSRSDRRWLRDPTRWRGAGACCPEVWEHRMVREAPWARATMPAKRICCCTMGKICGDRGAAAGGDVLVVSKLVDVGPGVSDDPCGWWRCSMTRRWFLGSPLFLGSGGRSGLVMVCNS